MSRVQLALNVTDVDAAVDFYTKLFATPVNKRKPGYANFEIAEPPLKLVLIESAEGGSQQLDSLGHRPVPRPFPALLPMEEPGVDEHGQVM